MRIEREHQLYEQIARYLQLQYPDVIYRFDLAADMKLTVGQAAKHKRLHPRRGYPDLFVAEPIDRDKGEISWKKFNGMFLELKKEGTRVLKKDGTPATEHIGEQLKVLEALGKKGYACYMVCGFDEAKDVIDEYLKG